MDLASLLRLIFGRWLESATSETEEMAVDAEGNVHSEEEWNKRYVEASGLSNEERANWLPTRPDEK